MRWRVLLVLGLLVLLLVRGSLLILLAVVEVAALPLGAVAANSKEFTQVLQPLVKGAKYVYRRFKKRELRRGIVPDIYGM